MKWILAILFPILVLPLQSVLWIPADLLFLAIVVYAFYEEMVFAFAVTLIYGFFIDVLSFCPLGTHIFGYGAVFCFVRYFRAKVPFDGWISRFIWILFLAMVLYSVKILFLYWIADMTRSVSAYLVLWIGNGLAGLLLVPLLRFYQNLTPDHFVEEEDSLLRKSSWT